ncbi:MAG: hypothetical protein AB1489_08475 [Acidobacteriota bacterium]
MVDRIDNNISAQDLSLTSLDNSPNRSIETPADTLKVSPVSEFDDTNKLSKTEESSISTGLLAQQLQENASSSIDVETMKLKRLIDKRSQMFDML